MSERWKADLDRHITGNYGEDQFRDERDEAAEAALLPCEECGKPIRAITDEDRDDGYARVCTCYAGDEAAYYEELRRLPR